MRKIDFTKMSGAGNDFLVLEAHAGLNYPRLALKACARTNGIGADGLLILDKSIKADYKMRIINANGSEAEMCGNGIRCLAAYISRNKKPRKKMFTIETLAGIIEATVIGTRPQVHLPAPTGYRACIPIMVNGHQRQVSYIDTGVPHTIVFVNDLDKIDVATIGRVIRYHDQFKPRGTNVDFVEEVNNRLVCVRTYERGVEAETKACGTGSVATAIIFYLRINPDIRFKKAVQVKVRTIGGEILEVTFDINEGQAINVWLKGSANFIARGEYYV